jgi:hypothetical protein
MPGRLSRGVGATGLVVAAACAALLCASVARGTSTACEKTTGVDCAFARALVLKVELPDSETGLIEEGARAKVRCDRLCDADVQLAVRTKEAARLGVRPTIAGGGAKVGAGASRWIHLWVSPGAARALTSSPGTRRPYVVVRVKGRAL